MRKLTAILSAIVLALVFAGLLLGVKSSLSGERASWLSGWLSQLRNKPANEGPELTASEPVVENLSYEEHLAKGQYYFDRGFYAQAANQFVRASHLKPKEILPYMHLMEANFKLGHYDRVKTNAEVILGLQPNHFKARYLLALTTIRQSDFNGAKIAFSQFSAQETDGSVLYYRALLAGLEDSKAVEQPLRELRKISLDGKLNQKIDKILAGYSEFNSAQAAEKLYLDELFARGLNQAGEYEMAIFKLKNILKERLDLRDAWIMLGFAYLNLEKYYFALTAFEKAYELDTEWPPTQYFLGLTYEALDRPEDAALYLKYAIDNGFEPQIVVKRKLADLLMEEGKYEEAVKWYQEVIVLNQHDLNAFVRPVWLYIDYLKKPEKAYEIARIALQLFPGEALSYNLLGWSEAAIGKTKEAEEHLKKAVELNPMLPAAHYNLGKLYEDQDRLQEALQAYQQAYEKDQQGSIGNRAAERYNALLKQ